MECEYIIVQAGGKGTRMEHLTANKPKALVPINNLPMLFHLFRKYPDKKYIIIGDYKADVLEKYLEAFAKVKYLLVNAAGKTGTCAGMREAVSLIPEDKAFMIIWSDLILPQEFEMPKESGNYVGLSKDFRCRWRYEQDVFEEIPSTDTGVAGLFLFKDKSIMREVPEEGEYVRWLRSKGLRFDTVDLYKTKEYGLISEYNKLETKRCRPFNNITVHDGRIVKEGIDEQGRELAVKEKAWYKYVENLGYTKIPQVYSYDPFEIELIDGRNIYEYEELSLEDKRRIMVKIVDALKELHSMDEGRETDYYSIWDTYVTKTFKRLDAVRNLIPFADEKYITVNGRKCRNVFFFRKELEEKFRHYKVPSFKLIHGDCTFSNMMLKQDSEPVLIDPRGYFGYTKMYGDVAYDWAKVYYSLKGDYDRFNLKKFRLDIGEDGVTLDIESNQWSELEQEFLELIRDEVSEETIKLIHAVIWLSLTTYAWEDYDSICGAFYNGVYYLEEIL